jgi:quaternary ammonium compound-resistance protein SugE
MAWLLVFLAGLAELGWMVGLKLSDGFTRIGWVVATLVAMAVSVILLAFAVRTIPMGTAYAVWTGIGAVGIVVVGILFFGEPRTFARIAFISCILVGIVGLKLTTSE